MRQFNISFHHSLIGMSLALCLILGVGLVQALRQTPSVAASNPIATPPQHNDLTATTTPTPGPLPHSTSAAFTDPAGVTILAMRDGPFIHLFAFHPFSLPLTRLTDNPWDDMQPALSPDGHKLAFVSRRNGFWDIYILSLDDFQLLRLTDTPEYDGNPTWSPDGQWIAYESWINGNLEILVKSVTDLTQPSIRLTEDPANDFYPRWSPHGREIAFVSNRNGNNDIWLARLDQVDGRFLNLTSTPTCDENHPEWSPDGRYLAWDGCDSGNRYIYVWDGLRPQQSPQMLMESDHPVWLSQDKLLSNLHLPNSRALTGFDLANRTFWFPAIPAPGEIHGMTWGNATARDLIERYALPGESRYADLYAKALSPTLTLDSTKRARLVALDNLNAPYPYLSEAAAPSFELLRQEAARLAGWDILGNLQNAYIPISDTVGAGGTDEWLLTARAFALNPLLLQAQWMTLVREDFQGETYWRVFIKTRYQDGSQGLPLIATSTWNLDARYSGNPRAYEQGGAPAPAPDGYWLDFTELAQTLGWERVPALQFWRTYYPAARFNQFVFRQGLDWVDAMKQLYPDEALNPPTPIPTLTLTPSLTATPRYILPSTPTPVSTSSNPPPPRPTLTPFPDQRGP